MRDGTEPNGARGGARPDPGHAHDLGVAVIDPIPLFRDGLAAMVHRAPGLRWAGYAANQHAALQLCERTRPRVALLDSALDPHSHLTRLLHADDPGLCIVVVVRDCHRNAGYLRTVLASGAHAAVPRDADMRRVIEAIRHGRTDHRYLDPALALFAAGRRQPPRPRSGDDHDGTPVPLPMPLSRREYQVLQLIAEGLENAAVAKALYVSVETVRTHVKNILRKLSARDRTHAVTTAFRNGILVPVLDDALTDRPDDLPLAAPRQRGTV